MDVALQSYVAPVAGSALMQHLSSPEVLAQAAAQIQPEARQYVPPAVIGKRGRGLIEIARGESHQIIAAAHSVLPRKITRNPEETASHLRNSAVLGRVIGSVTGHEETKDGRVSSDHELVDEIQYHSDRYLRHDAGKRRVSFTEDGIDLLRPFRKPGAGCPVIDKVVTLGGSNAGLFNLGWAEFTEEYIARRVMSRGVFQRVLRTITP